MSRRGGRAHVECCPIKQPMGTPLTARSNTSRARHIWLHKAQHPGVLALLAEGRPPLALCCTAHSWQACQTAPAALGQQVRQKWRWKGESDSKQ